MIGDRLKNKPRLVDGIIDRSYPVVKAVYDHLQDIQSILENIEVIKYLKDNEEKYVQAGEVAKSILPISEHLDEILATRELASNSKTYSEDSLRYQLLSKQWATQTHEPVEGDLYGSKYYAELAEDQANKAVETKKVIDELNASAKKTLFDVRTSENTVAGYVKTAENHVKEAQVAEHGAFVHQRNAEIAQERAELAADSAQENQKKSAKSEANAKDSEVHAKASEDMANRHELTTKEYLDTAFKYRQEIISSNTATQEVADQINARVDDSIRANEVANQKANEAKVSADNAKVSETNALASEQKAKASEEKAKASELASKASEDKARQSETNALASENKAKTSETNALSSANASANSASQAKTSEISAQASKEAAAKSARDASDLFVQVTDARDKAKASEVSALEAKNQAQEFAIKAEASATKAEDFTEALGSPLSRPANLRDLENVEEARTNLGLGALATKDSLTFSEVEEKPTTLSGYGITDAYTKAETGSLVNVKANKATTLEGYGITDAYTKVQTSTFFPTRTEFNKVDTKVSELATTVSGKADKSVTLAGYKIGDAYTKAQVDEALALIKKNNQSAHDELTNSLGELKEGKADKATTLEGYGITDALTKVQTTQLLTGVSGEIATVKEELTATIDTKADTATTLAGYGITDAYTRAEGEETFSRIGELVQTFVSGYKEDIDKKADKATTIAGYGINDSYTKSEVDSKLGAKANKATTLSGYGITDAYTKTEVNDQRVSRWGDRGESHGWFNHTRYQANNTTLTFNIDSPDNMYVDMWGNCTFNFTTAQHHQCSTKVIFVYAQENSSINYGNVQWGNGESAPAFGGKGNWLILTCRWQAGLVNVAKFQSSVA